MNELALELIEENKKTKSKFLDLGNCGLTEIPVQLIDCYWLEELNLATDYIEENGNYITTINKGNPNALIHLNSKSLKDLKELKVLHLNGTTLNNLSGIEQLQHLQTLDLSDNGISDLSGIEQLQHLQTLYLRGNGISDLSGIEQLQNLQSLDLNGNQISIFNAQLLKCLPNLSELRLFNNPINNVPKEIYNQYDNCLQDIKNYFKGVSTDHIDFFEAKVILVGNGRVGKTSLVNRLVDNSFNEQEPSTHAIQIRE